MNNDTGAVVAVQLCPGHRKVTQPVQSAMAVEGVGLEGDVHALRDSIRQVLLVEQETLEALDLSPGSVKENVSIRGISLMSLMPGQTLQIGDTILKITKPCGPCLRKEEIRAGLSQQHQGRRGMLARVMKGGVTSRGDSIVPR